MENSGLHMGNTGGEGGGIQKTVDFRKKTGDSDRNQIPERTTVDSR